MKLFAQTRFLPVAVVLLALAACGDSSNQSPALSAAAEPAGDARLASSADSRSVREPVEIVRDKYGVSHIYAKNPRDLFFAQGYNAARDRLWQLDQWRRRGEGRMAEQFGMRFVAADRAARLFLYRGDLDAEFASYHPQGKEILTAFAGGINAFIDETKAEPAKLPIEFQLTGSEPGYWSPTSSLIRIFGLTRNLTSEVAIARRISAVGLDAARNLIVQEPPDRPLTIPAGIDLATITPEILATYNLARDGLPFEADDFRNSPLGAAERARLAGSLSAGNRTERLTEKETRALQLQSNNWTIAGSKTASGKPILANDPHRSIQMPSLRYMVHLNAPGWNVIGAGEPALPGVSIGHNDRIAFGLTIFAFGDEEDLYVYETNSADPGEYRYNGQWEAMRVVEDSIPVRGAQPQKVAHKFTRHGPVIHEDPANRKAYAVRAAYLEFAGTAAYLASLRLNQARNWTEFSEGMARHFTPSENMVYADVEGNIGWFGGSITPIRSNADWSGLLPVPGDGRYEWNGYLPGALLPRVFNPREGFYATANEFNVPDGYQYRGLANTVGWADPYRAQRIKEVLRGGGKFSMADSAKLQNDYLSIPARTLVPLLAGLGTADADVAEALTSLGQWDYVAGPDSVAATIFELWLPKVVSRVSMLMVPEAGRAAFGDLSTPVVIAKLAAPDAIFGGDPTAGRNALLLESLKAAMTDLKARQGEDRAQWTWGSLHHIQFQNPLTPLLSAGLAESLTTARFPVGGTGDTVGVAFARESDFRVVAGASYRQVIDLSDWDKSLTINVPGQSSDPASPYYENLIEPWSKGEYFPMAFSRGAVEALKADVVVLQPQSR